MHKDDKNMAITPRIDMKNQNHPHSEVLHTATFGKGDEFTSFNKDKNNF